MNWEIFIHVLGFLVKFDIWINTHWQYLDQFASTWNFPSFNTSWYSRLLNIGQSCKADRVISSPLAAIRDWNHIIQDIGYSSCYGFCASLTLHIVSVWIHISNDMYVPLAVLRIWIQLNSSSKESLLLRLVHFNFLSSYSDVLG